MISVNKARERLSANLERSLRKKVSLKDSLGYILAEDVHSSIDVPSFNNSSKDGYAVKFDAKREFYSLGSTIQAGDTSSYEIPEGEAARIFTGAKMPEAADTVGLKSW